MKLRRSNVALGFLVLNLFISALAPALVERMPLERLIREADLILAAQVLSTDSQWVAEGEGRGIYTTVTLRPGRILKGLRPTGTLTLRLPGGTVGGITRTVSDTPGFKTGDEAVLFLCGTDPTLVGAFQGRFPVRDGRVWVEGIAVDVSRFQDAVKRFAADADFDLYGALLRERPAVESVGTVSPLDLDRLNKTATPPAPPQRAVTANIVMAQWDYEVDYDDDGYVQFGKFYWDVDVKGGGGTLAVYDKIYWRLTGTTTWSLLTTTPVYTITGVEESDARVMSLYSGARHDYDFRIESYQEGAAAPDDFADPSTNEWACIAYKMEPPAEDAGGSGPVIIEMQPEKASAGTGTEVYIRGVGLGDGSGASSVEFYYDGRDPMVVLPTQISSWTDNAVTVKVPIGYVDGYPGSAATGPVNLYSSSGAKAPSYDFDVSFGYGGSKWFGDDPQVAFYVSTLIADWTEALTAAATTWSSVGNITLYYDGDFTGPTTSNNKNEIARANLSSGVIAQASYSSRGGKMIECDITFNSDYNFSTAATTPPGAFDVESIALHEMGHWIGLRDLYGMDADRQKVMYGYSNQGPSSMRRSPHPDDAAGIAWIYGLDTAPVADFAWFAGRPEIGTAIQFRDESALAPAAWLWDFGDGSSSTLQNPTHVFLFSGTFPVTLTATNAFGSSSVTKTVIVHGRGIVPPVPSSQPYAYILPAAAKAQGANYTNWLSDVVLYNPGNSEASVYVYFLQSGQDNSGAAGSEMVLPGFRFVRVGDIVGSMFRLNNLAGALLVASSQPLVLTSRTYNDQGDDGTYGQFIPATLSSKLLTGGEEGLLLHLAKSAGYRTNVGGVNAGAGTIDINFAFYRPDKTLIGNWPYTLRPYEHIQKNYVLDTLTSANVDDAYAVVTCSTAGAVYTAYASVADNVSSDPIFIPIQRKGDIQGQAHQVVAAAARTKGGYGSNWRTDLRLYNPFTAQSVTLTFVNAAGSQTASLNIGQGELISKNDVLTSLFPGITGDTAGALHVQSTQGLIITSRTYTETSGLGTFGQFIPARGAASDLIASGETGLLLQLANTANYRSNVGFTEYAGQAAQVQVKLFDADRLVLGFKTYSVAALGNYQINIFNDLGLTGEITAAMAEVRVLSGGTVYAYASVVDNRPTSNDAFFIPAQK